MQSRWSGLGLTGIAVLVVLATACGGSSSGGAAGGAAPPAPVPTVAAPAAVTSPTSGAPAKSVVSPSPVAARLQPSCPTPHQVQGFLTCADVAKAEQEGAVVYYSPDVEPQMVAYLTAFHDLFPKIDTSKYFREQTGRLYAKLSAERQANNYVDDVLSLSDYAIVLDFIQKNAYARYISPESVSLRPEFLSDPPGLYSTYTINLIGMAVNSTVIPPAEAPKNYQDLLDPKWKGGINFKDSAAGTQAVQWVTLRKLYGDQYWKAMAAQQPHGLASTVQQFERLVNREDKIAGLAQYSTYLENKAKGAPLDFIVPTEGLLALPIYFGLVDKAPHPEAAKLFIDFLLSKPGQQVVTKVSLSHSPRPEVDPPPGAKPISDFKLLLPDWNVVIASHDQFVKEWNDLTGLQ